MSICLMCQKENIRSGKSMLQRDPRFGENYRSLKEDEDVCEDCARSYLIGRYQEEVYRPAFQQLFDIVNAMGYNGEGIHTEAISRTFLCQHRHMQHEQVVLLRSILKAIGKKSGDDNWEDARNEWALAHCKKMGEVEI